MMFLPDPLEIIIAGEAGQGAVLAGTLAAAAAATTRSYTSQTSRTGAAVRHGSAEAHVVISKAAIDFPYIEHPYFLLALNQSAVDRHGAAVRQDGAILYDPAETTVREASRCGRIAIPASRETDPKGIVLKHQNFVLLGALTAFAAPISLQRLLETLRQLDRLLPDAEAAILLGAHIGNETGRL